MDSNKRNSVEHNTVTQLTATDNKDTMRFSNILCGSLWISLDSVRTRQQLFRICKSAPHGTQCAVGVLVF